MGKLARPALDCDRDHLWRAFVVGQRAQFLPDRSANRGRTSVFGRRDYLSLALRHRERGGFGKDGWQASCIPLA